MNPALKDFYRKYQIEEFYQRQAKTSSAPVRPFRSDKHQKLSHGVLPGFRNYDLFYERYLSAVEIIQKMGIVRDGTQVLDVGAGEGFFKFFFDAKCPKRIEWSGIEVWPERAEFCRHLGYDITSIDLDNEPMPYPDQSFDMVLASHVIEHLQSPPAVLREMGRVLRPGGIVLIATPTKLPVIAWLDALYHRLSNRNTGDTQQAFTHGSLQKMILKTLDWPASSVVDKRGFRIFSSRKKLPLENWKWFYDASVWMGKNWPLLVPEVNIILQKPTV